MGCRISVVTVCYNAVDCIEQTMLSVLDQTYHDIEYIIIDGGSTDGTVDIIKKYADRLAYWISEPDKGIYDAMNKGIAVATGDYINFMNAGDTFRDQSSIYTYVDVIKPESEIIYGDVIIKYHSRFQYRKPLWLDHLSECLPFCHQSVIVKTGLLRDRQFDTSYRILGDYDFFYSCYKRGLCFQYIPEALSVYDSTEGVSKDCLSEIMAEKFRIWGIEHNWLLKLPWQVKLIKDKSSHAIKKILPPCLVLQIKGLLYKFRR
ncbi:glycosyltransferase family 2 protein [Paramuribaculum intestinale]|uniref:glycosyltransferase family 2 protein n=1 Tax=Paramuribaculum intestinale TaxID=2094151 RepID=UPI001A2E4BDA|nr:glycosyltransferase family 2 protein [Paramuribaculum intestinale]MBJ2185250.1 glycosyltransferase [Muribaculaceae bacterium]